MIVKILAGLFGTVLAVAFIVFSIQVVALGLKKFFSDINNTTKKGKQ